MFASRVLVLLLASSTLFGQWNRYVQTITGDRTDSPSFHTLQHFRTDPCLRTGPKERILGCGSENPTKAEADRLAKTRTDLKLVGKIGLFRIYDLYYLYCYDDSCEDQRVRGARSILVGSASDQFHEIQFTARLGPVYPSEILKIGTQQVLKTKSDDGGNYHFVYEDYFAFANGKAELIDLQPIWEAARGKVPKPFEVYEPASKMDFSELVFEAGTENANAGIGPKVACCIGKVSVIFQLVGGLVHVTGAKYDPEGWNK